VNIIFRHSKDGFDPQVLLDGERVAFPEALKKIRADASGCPPHGKIQHANFP